MTEFAEERADAAGMPPIPEEDVAFPDSPWWEEMLLTYGPGLFGLPVRIWDTATIFLLAALADVCLYKAPGGTGVACVLSATVVGLIVVRRKWSASQALYPAIVVILVGLMAVWRHWWLLEVVGWTSILILAVKLHRPEWQILEALWAACSTIIRAPARLFGHVLAAYVRSSEDETETAGWQTKRIPLRVVLIPAGVCIVFILIFSAANPVIGRLVAALRDNVRMFFECLGDLISLNRALIWLAWLALFAALIRPMTESWLAKLVSKFSATTTAPLQTAPDKGNYAAAFWTLICVNILFLAYNCTDSTYLYFKADLPIGINWTEYTYSGCGWLTMGLFVSTVVLGIIFAGALNFHPGARRLKVISYVWAAQNMMLAIGAIRRLQMYIDYSGLTHLRITGLYGSVLVAVGLAIMVRKVRANRSFMWLARKDILAFCIALTILAVTPNDLLCAKYNVAKVMEGKSRALRPICLKSLSPEALPPLIALLDLQETETDETRAIIVTRGIAGILGQHLVNLEADEAAGWSTWQGSGVWALKHLRAVRKRIHDTAPPREWESARQTLVDNMDI